MRSSSYSKSIIDPRSDAKQPEIPILETEDLPADDDWALMQSLAVARDDVDDFDSDPDQTTIGSGDFD